MKSLFVVIALLAASQSACSLRSIALNTLADTFAATGSSYSSDDDPELVRDAVPFALKTMEQVAAEKPRHRGLRRALASGLTQYAYAFVVQEADESEDHDMARSAKLRVRARKLCLRARDHGLAGLDAAHPGFAAALANGNAASTTLREAMIASTNKEDVALLYWTAAAWALAISNGKDQMHLVGDLPLVEKLMSRALALDETYDEGAIHEFYVTYEGGRSAAEGGGPAKAKAELDRARALSANKKLGGLVSFAEAVDVATQNRTEFVSLLEEVVAYDVDKDPPHRLANVIAQRRARWLITRADELFAE